MAITDKVIELSPVNKKKNIIFYIIMGVLLATTILFLLLFILKPAASTGEISGLELTSNLYKDGDSYIAAKGEAGKEYTICAAIGYSGDETFDTSLDWVLPTQFKRTNANEITDSDKQEARLDATLAPDENTKVVYEYCKFTIDTKALSDNKATITVRTRAKNKEEEAFQTKTIDIIVRDVGARDIDFTRVATGKDTPPASLTPGDGEGIDAVLRLPYIERSAATSYTIFMDQLPEVDSTGREMPITARLTDELSSSGKKYASNAILAETEGEQNAIILSPVDESASDAFSFVVSQTGMAIVKVTCNKFNASAEITKKVKIVVNPINDFDVITEYKLMESSVDTGAATAPAGKGITEIELLAGAGGGSTDRNDYDLQSHIVVTPWRLEKSWFSSKNVSIACLDEKDKPLVNTIVKTEKNGQGITLRPLSPGTAYVVITDTSENSIGTTLKFKVNVRYDVTKFGYGDKTEKTRELKPITGSENNELEVTYLLTGKTANVNPNEIFAQLRLSAVKGITFHNMNKSLPDVIDVTPRFVSLDKNGNAIMRATLTYDVKPDIGKDPVTFTLTPLGSSYKEEVLTVTVKAHVEATHVAFISPEEWTALKEKHIAADPLMEYATYSVDAAGDATLRLNMSNNPDYYTKFTLGELVRFFDKDGNGADVTDVTGSGDVTVKLSENYGNAFRLSGDTPSPLLSIRPIYVGDATYSNQNSASITFTVREETRELTIVVIDTPQQLGYSDVVQSFTYGSPAKNEQVDRSVTVLPSTIKQTYASGAERNPSNYFVSVYINSLDGELIAVDPYKFADKSLITSEQIPYVYYFASEGDARALETKAGEITDETGANELRQQARGKALFAIRRSYSGNAKDVHLLSDLYQTKYDGNKISQVLFSLYPCSSDGTPEYKYAAEAFAVTPVRLIDKIVLDCNGIKEDETTTGRYLAQATSGSRVSVTIKAGLYTGTAADGAPTGMSEVAYSKDDANLETLDPPRYDAGEFTTDTSGHTFNMPVVSSGTGNEKSVVIGYRSSQADAELDLTVHNRTLSVSEIKLYKNEARTQEIADGEYILLNTLLQSVAYDKIYYEVKYDGTNLSDFISYETVSFEYDETNLYVKYDAVFPNGNNAIADNGGKTEFTGSITLHGLKTGTSVFYMRPAVTEQTSNKIFMLAYTPSSGIKMTDNANGNTVFSSGDGVVDAVTMNIASATDKPSKQWTLKRFFEKENENIEAGGTSYDVTVRQKSNSVREASTGVIGDVLNWSYDTGSQTLTLASTGKGIASPLSLEVVITEYASNADGTKIKELATHIIEFTVTVTVSVYKVDLTIDPDTSGANRLAFVTNGGTGTVEKKLGAILNNNNADHIPTNGTVTYKLYKDSTDITGNTTHKFRLETKADGFTYVVVDNSVLNLDATYRVSAVSGGRESAKVTLSLTTSAEHIAFTSLANVVNGNTYTSHNKNDKYILSADVRNSGTNEPTPTKAVTYTVLKKDGAAYGAGETAPAVVDASGELTFNNVGSAEFKVEISCGTLPKLTVNFVYANAVTQIKTVFEGHTSTSGDLPLSTVLYDGTQKPFSIGDVTLIGTNGKPYTGATYEVVWTPNNGVFTYDKNEKEITYVGPGTSTFTLRAETYPGSNTYIERTFTLEAKAPTFTASFARGDTESVNIMGLSANKDFALTLSSASGSVSVTKVALNGTSIYPLNTPSLEREGGNPQSALRERVDGRVDNNSLFTFSGNTLTLNYAAFSTVDVDLSSAKTYEFTVSATVNGVNAANEVKLYIRVSADKTYSTPQFDVIDTSVSPSKIVTEKTLKRINSGKYELAKISGCAITETFAYTVSGATLSDGKLTFANVGNVVISATYTKYQKTFDIGTRTFFVTNDGYEITSTLSMFTAASDGKYYIDYSSDTDKKQIYYTIDWNGAGRDFIRGDFDIHFNSDILTQSNVEYNTASKTAKWTFTVNKPGTTTIFASTTKDGAYYASTEQSATFSVSARPTGSNFTISADPTSLDPTAPATPAVILSGASNASAVEESHSKPYATITPKVSMPANFLGDYTITYTIVSGGEYVTLGAKGTDNTMLVTAKWTYGGGTARIRATLSVTSGYHKGTTLEQYIDITVAGANEGTFTLTQPTAPVILSNASASSAVILSGASNASAVEESQSANTYQIIASATKGSGDEGTPAISYTVTSGSTYATVNATSGLVTVKSDNYDGGTVTVKVTATFTRNSHLGGGTYTKEGFITVYVAPTKLYSATTEYKVTAGESIALNKPYVLIDGTNTPVTSVAYSTTATTDLGAINGEKFESVVGAGGSANVSVTASLTAGVFSVQNLTLTGGYTVKVLGLTASTTIPTVTADGRVLELDSSYIKLSPDESVTGRVTAIETYNSDLSINSDDRWKLSVDFGTHRYFGDTAPANISVRVKVQATSSLGTHVGYITVNIVPRKVEVSVDDSGAAKTLSVGKSFTVTYTIDEFTTSNNAITDVRMDATNGTCSAVKLLEDNKTKLVYTYTALTATASGSPDTATMKVEICGHVYTLGEIKVTVNPAPVVPELTPKVTNNGNDYTFAHEVKKGNATNYSYTVRSGSEAIVGGSIADNAAGFTVKQPKYAVDIVIEVTATITATDGGTHTITERLEAIHVTAAPAPTFTSTATQDSTNNKLYTINNVVEHSTGTPTYSYKIISGEDAVVGKSIANNATSFTVQECDEVTTLVIEVTANIPTSYGEEIMSVVLEKIIVPALASSTVLSSSLSHTDDAYTITNTLSKDSYTATYEYSVTSGSEAIDGSITKGTGSDANKATFNVKHLDKDVYVRIEITATVKINAWRTETHKATVTTLVSADPPVFTSSWTEATETDKYNITNSVSKVPSGAHITYTYRVLSNSDAIKDGEIADNATSFQVNHLSYAVDVVIEVTATVKESADGATLYTFTKVLDPIHVDALEPAPSFTSTFAAGEGTDANKYTITNNLANPPAGEITYTYIVIKGEEAIDGYTDATNNGITLGTGENANTATFTAKSISTDTTIYIKVTATVTPTSGGGKQTFTAFLEIPISATTEP